MSDEAREGIDHDLAQIDHTIGQFMEYAMPASVARDDIDVSELIGHLVVRERTLTEVRGGGGQLHSRIEPELYARITPADLQRAATNLIENARKYGSSPQRPLHIDVQVYAHGAELRIDVCDRGPGISAEDAQHLTRPFVRGTQARTDAGGAGLGLSIVKRLLAPADGQLALLPRTGGGLCARIILPLAAK